jgi:hypothetical protein
MEYILIIASNVGMGLIMLIIYFRYSHFRISSNREMKELRTRIDDQVKALQDGEQKLFNATKSETKKVEDLLREIDELRKSRENDIKLKAELEKQLEITLTQNKDLEKHLIDLKSTQEHIIQDTKEAVAKMGNDLYKKVNDSNKIEIETAKNLMGKAIKLISEYMEKIAKATIVAKSSSSNDNNNQHHENQKEETKIQINNNNQQESFKILPLSNHQMVDDLIETMKVSGHLVNKNYFIPANFDSSKSKLLLCEVVFINGNQLYIIDFKSCHYFDEFNNKNKKELSQNENPANEALNELNTKCKVYLTFLQSSQYQKSILSIFTNNKDLTIEKTFIIAVVSSRNDLQLAKTTKIYESFQQKNIQMMDFDDISNIVI